ncbi:MAG: hypothetical protein HPZ91_02610 [Lentisphaeria bacterium]|nr:hypothetical protein [Lentisphaeria bacterium]
MVKPLWILAVTLAGAGVVGAVESGPDRETPRAALKAYAAMDYAQAGKLAKQIPDTPEGQLIGGLCDLYDRSRQDVKRGQLTLAELFYNDKMPLEYRLEAGVALGRTAQLMKERRELYGSAGDRYDHVKIFGRVMEMAPGSSAARNAFLYLIRERLEDPEQRNAAFEDLELFFRNFSGDPKLLPPLHLLAEYEYIRLKDDYRTAARHLREGYEIGFANPNENRSGLFRLAFLYHKKIGDKPMAVKYYNEYLKRYPYSGQAVVAQRFLEELGEGGGRK